MPEYIERSDALSEIDKWMESVGTALIGKGLSYYAELQGCIEDCKAADVAPVRHGRWMDKGSLSCRCSECGCKNYKETQWCPNCGAKMDG